MISFGELPENNTKLLAGYEPTLSWVRFRVWARVGLGSGLGLRKGWVGTGPATRPDPVSLSAASR